MDNVSLLGNLPVIRPIYITSREFRRHYLKKSIVINTVTCNPFEIGDPVNLFIYSESTGKILDKPKVMFVQEVKNVIPLYLDDDAIEITLVSASYMLESILS